MVIPSVGLQHKPDVGKTKINVYKLSKEIGDALQVQGLRAKYKSPGNVQRRPWSWCL
jgi:hypothetical protein